jgi:hypothetical protein
VGACRFRRGARRCLRGDDARVPGVSAVRSGRAGSVVPARSR